MLTFRGADDFEMPMMTEAAGRAQEHTTFADVKAA